MTAVEHFYLPRLICSWQEIHCSNAQLLCWPRANWRRGDSNPRPEMHQDERTTHLVVFIFYRLWDRQTTANRFGYSGICLNPSARKPRREQPTFLRPNQARRRNLKGRVAYLGGHLQLVVAN